MNLQEGSRVRRFMGPGARRTLRFQAEGILSVLMTIYFGGVLLKD